jgi:hypothetical protein
MDQEAEAAQESVTRIGHIPRHLYHPRFAGLRYDSGKVNFARHQAHDEEHVIPYQSDRRPHFDREKVRRRHCAPMNSEEFLPGHSLAPLWRWIQAAFAQNVRDGAASDLMSQIGQGTLDARVTPRPIFPCHSEDQLSDVHFGRRATGLSVLARVVFPGNQATVPGQESVGCHDAGKTGEAFSPNRFAFGSETTALIVV